MDNGLFKSQLIRLQQVFSSNSYPAERQKLIWQECQYLTNSEFIKMVDFFIGEFKTAPLLPEFRDFISKLREMQRLADRERQAKDAKDFWNSSYHKDDVKWIVQMIKARLLNEVSDEDYSKFLSTLKEVAVSSERIALQSALSG